MKKYNIHVSSGEQNAMILINSRGKYVTSELQELAIKASDAIIKIITDKIEHNKPVGEDLEEEVIDLMAKFNIEPATSSEENSSIERDSFFDRTGINYDWRQRSEQLQIEVIKNINSSELGEEQRRLESTKSATERANKIKELITDAFIKKINANPEMTNIEFAEDFYPQLQTLVDRFYHGEKVPYNTKTIARMVGSIKKTGFIKKTEHSGGKPSLIVGEVETCLVCTVIDFPQWSGEERASYLMSERGPLYGRKISARTINEYLNEHQFKYKKIAFSPKARNTLGSIIARRVWSYFVKQMIDDHTIFIFIDESSVDGSSTRMYGRGYIGVTPTAERGLTSFSLSLLNAVIPGSGCIQQWFTQGICNDNFASFIKQLGYIISTHIVSPNITVISILDNCNIHKTDEALDSFKAAEIIPLFTVPYSPQTNYPAECYFGNCKASINNIDAVAIIRTIGFQNAIWKSWEKVNDIHGSADATANLFAAWLIVLDQCIKAVPLGSGPYQNQNSDEIIKSLKRFEARRGTNEELLNEYEKSHANKEMRTSADNHDECSIIHSVTIDHTAKHRHRKAKEEV